MSDLVTSFILIIIQTMKFIYSTLSKEELKFRYAKKFYSHLKFHTIVYSGHSLDFALTWELRFLGIYPALNDIAKTLYQTRWKSWLV